MMTTIAHVLLLALTTWCIIFLTAPPASAATVATGGGRGVPLLEVQDGGGQQQHQQTDRDLQQGSLDEPFTCIPLSELRGDSRFTTPENGAVEQQCLSYNACTNPTTLTSCCRINLDLAWLVCDPANSFARAGLPCVCSDFTGLTQAPTDPPTTPAPTRAPTSQPTPPPIPATPEPTPQPTPRTPEPTPQPTVRPTPEPTPQPTQVTPEPTPRPTVRPTSQPTAEPTRRPVTAQPTFFQAQPTAEPTRRPVTAQPTVEPTRRPVTASPTVEPTRRPVTARPTNRPTTAQRPSMDSNNNGGGTGTFETQDTVDEDEDGNEVRVRVSQCNSEPPDLEIVQTQDYVYRYSVNVNADVSGTAWVETLSTDIHDAIADEFFECDFDDGSNTQTSLWVLPSQIPHQVVRRCPQNGSSTTDVDCWVVEGRGAVRVVPPSTSTTAVNRDENGGNNRELMTIALRRQQQNEHPPTHSRALQADEAQIFVDDVMTYVRSAMLMGEFNDGDVILDVALNEEGTPEQAPSPSPTASGLSPPPPSNSNSLEQGPTDPPSSNDSGGLSTPIIAAIAVGSAFVALLAVMALTRQRKRRRQERDAAQDSDREYLQKAEDDATGGLEVNHLDLHSNPNTSGESGGYYGDEPMPIVVANFSDQDELYNTDSFTSTKKVVRSPSKRSQRGPLGSQDELSVTGSNAIKTPLGSQADGSENKPRGYSSNDTIDL